VKKKRKKGPSEAIKIKARSAVFNALKAGRLVRNPCKVCGDVKSEAHHEDYSNPLEVEWLCRWHHAERHGHTMDPQRLQAILDGLRAGRTASAIALEIGIDRKVIGRIRRGVHPSTQKLNLGDFL
jgi:hypothetical protein